MSELLKRSDVHFFFISMIIFIVYWGGLSGNFMLDDWSVLPSLYQTIEACGMSCGILSGSTGPTGRPLSLLSFAIQEPFWPSAFSFKLVNLIIHIMNAFLVLIIFRKILNKLNLKESSVYLPLLAAFLWAIWPLQVSTVLYVVQRMVLLSSFFTLLGVVLYLHYRNKFNFDWHSEPQKIAFFLLSLTGLGVSALLSKESGVLLIVYIFIIEFTLYKTDNSRLVKIFRLVCLVLPFLGLIFYLIYKVTVQGDFIYSARDFNLEERILTQGRVLVDYVNALFLPKVSSLGLYHDAYLKSLSWWNPISTFYSWACLAISFLAAFFLRNKIPLVSLSIFWFLGGHLLESTVLPLELYFEHRNYLPSIFLSLVFVYYSTLLIKKASKPVVRMVFTGVFALYFGMLIVITYSQANLWGNEFEYGLVQADEHPESVRARSLLVDVYNSIGRVDKAHDAVQQMKKDFPDVSGVLVSDIEFACYDAKYTLEPLDKLKVKLQRAKFGYGAIVSISNALTDLYNGECQAVSPRYLIGVIEALKINPLYAKKLNLLSGYHVAALTLSGDLDSAALMYSSMTLLPEHWPRYISILASLGRFEDALKVSEEALSFLSSKPQYLVYYDDVKRLQSIINIEIKQE